MGWIRAGVVASLAGWLMAVAPAAACPPQPPPAPPLPSLGSMLPTSLPDAIDRIVPAPVIPAPTSVSAALTGDPSSPTQLRALWGAVMPAPSGDPFFDDWPADLDRYRDGQIIAWRDVTPTAAPLVVLPVREVVQLKFRTDDSRGLPSFATATLVIPASTWASGPRPVLVNNLPIDALGRKCTPSYSLAHGFTGDTSLTDFLPPITHLAAWRGYAVLIPDHEGPRMAYAEPFVAGHAVLDAIRAARDFAPAQLGHSSFAMTGYSGGSIATVGAVKLIGSYAPELASRVVGAAMGGVPVDYALLTRSMNGNLASGVFMAAVFGIARERPEILAHMNHLAQWVATSPLKDQCIGVFALPGVLLLPIDVAADITHPLDSALAHRVEETTLMAGVRSDTPLFIYNGDEDWWIPAQGPRQLFAEQCRLGVTAQYDGVFGEHVTGYLSGFVPAVTWLDQRLHGVPAPDGCPAAPAG